MLAESFVLKANLFENGISISEGAKKFLNSKSDIWFMDNSYITCTGVSMHFDDQYITVSVRPESKYKLVENNEKIFISENEKNLFEATLIFPPNYMKGDIFIGGKKITKYVNTYTDRIRIQAMHGCANSCKFCNAKESGYNFNDIEGLDEAFQIALAQSNASHSFISTNNVKDEDGLKKLTEIIEYFGKKYCDMGLDLMTSPRGFTSYTDSSQYAPYLNHIKDNGIQGIAVDIELNNSDKFKYYCPEKFLIGQENYFRFIEQAVEIFGVNHVRSVLIVGLESLEETLKGVEKLAQRGCNPVLSPLFPYGEANIPPNAELFILAKTKSEKICEKYGIKMGPLCGPCVHNTL
ncbi:MAG: hypothetical protein LBI55_03345 [Oscillospiraceae bacterium]|jgi:hypothetical protein|nr:hypothetical protein [Oscillospiraceae bacterium]